MVRVSFVHFLACASHIAVNSMMGWHAGCPAAKPASREAYCSCGLCAGASLTLECSRRIGAELHVFGFNWNDAHADTHTIADEEKLFRAAEANGTLVIHPTGVI